VVVDSEAGGWETVAEDSAMGVGDSEVVDAAAVDSVEAMGAEAGRVDSAVAAEEVAATLGRPRASKCVTLLNFEIVPFLQTSSPHTQV
jgi:hypothetical protein